MFPTRFPKMLTVFITPLTTVLTALTTLATTFASPVLIEESPPVLNDALLLPVSAVRSMLLVTSALLLMFVVELLFVVAVASFVEPAPLPLFVAEAEAFWEQLMQVPALGVRMMSPV